MRCEIGEGRPSSGRAQPCHERLCSPTEAGYPGQPKFRGATVSSRLGDSDLEAFSHNPTDVLSQLLGASRRPAGGPRERVPAGAVAGEIREKGPARVQSRRRRPPYPIPPTGPPSTRRRTPPRAKPRDPRRARAGDEGEARAGGAGFRRRREEGDGATAPPAAARAQPRFAPQPDRPSP
ncbi:hypothetical protein Q5P01_000642 [Channa striata]|uniref:Uncharacterized protein n=1 Tax=Channa striata TaxID=64152 RepID=A0AA88IIJ0_CHASR|nr:hypothetical protein Q5P01_000642 [Channa striata]